MIIGVDLRCLDNNLTSGVSVYAYNLLKNLLLSDKKNTYKIFTNRQNLTKLKKKLKHPNIKIYCFNIPNKLLNLSLKFLNWPKIDHLLEGVDLIWFPNINFCAFSNKVKVLITVHDLTFKIMPEFFSLKRRLWHWLVNPAALYQKSTKIITVSENTKNDLIKFFEIDPAKIQVIYPGLENNWYNKYSENDLIDFKNNYLLSNHLILTVATLEPRKNIESVILAFEKLLNTDPEYKKMNWQLVIIGKRGWLVKPLYKILKNIKNSSQIKIIDNLPRNKLPLIYQLAKVFIWPSYYEGFGFPPQEAALHNLSIITSFNSSLVETLNQSILFINPFNIQELERALKTLIKNNSISNIKLEKTFNWQAAAFNFLKLIETI